MINLAANAFLYGQDPKDIERQLTLDQSEVSRLTLLRQRGAGGKLHNLVFYITRLPRRRAIFDKCQEENLALADHDKIYALIRDGGVRWNSTYMMIERAIKLKDSLDQYCYKMSKSADESDRSTIPDELQAKDWESLVGIKTILAAFFQTTKHLEANATTGTHGALWEVVIGMECLVLSLEEHHSRLAGDIHASAHLKTSIILALNKLEDYLGRTNRSEVWLASLVLNPKHKWDSIQALWGRRNKQSLLQASKIRVQTL